VSSRAIAALAGLTLLAASGASSAEKHQVSGTMTSAITRVERITVGDTPGHVVYLSEYEGVNLNSGEHVFLDNAKVINASFGDLVRGNGRHFGYITLMDKEGTLHGKWEGKITTTVSSDGDSVMTFEGTYEYTGGDGAYENIAGGGTYTGKFISEIIYQVDWEGEYYLRE
jgi:hypothetical protein